MSASDLVLSAGGVFETARPPAEVFPSSTSWYLVHAKPRQEQLALVNLDRQGYSSYMPVMSVERIRRGKAVVYKEPMFPRYLFVPLDSSHQGQS